MPAKTPLVSVTIPAFNNQDTIAQAIQSVLDQTFTDFELIVVNDGSEDRTEEIVKQFDDPRITYVYQENQGGSQATNRAIHLARGKYVALFAADDICGPERLERQYNFLSETGQGIVFSWVEFIDDKGQIIEGAHFALNSFNHPRRTQAEMVNWFFFNGNYLCTVSCMAERQIFLDAGLFRITSAQIPDLWMWGKLVKSYEFSMLTEKLVEYRIRANDGNVSGPHNSPRAEFEIVEFHRQFLRDMPVELFKKAFARHLKNADFQGETEYELEKAFLYLQHVLPGVRQLGAERLSSLFEDLNIVEASRAKYHFGLPELFLLTKSLHISANLEALKLKEWVLAFHSTNNEAQVYTETIKKEFYKAEEYALSLEAENKKLEEYLKSLEPAYQAAQEHIQHLDNAYQKVYSQDMQETLARYEQDLRQLQASRTVRLANLLSRLSRKIPF